MDSLPEVPGIALRSDGHVGVYVGGGYAVEERGFNYGCVKTRVKDRKWTHWYYLPFIDYGEGGSVKPPQTEYALGSRLLRKGTEGNDVKQLQEYLLRLGYSLPKYGADGDFGAETEAAVQAFQEDEGLEVDGKYGEKSHAALMDALSDDDDAPEQPAQPEDGEEENEGEKPRRYPRGHRIGWRQGQHSRGQRHAVRGASPSSRRARRWTMWPPPATAGTP